MRFYQKIMGVIYLVLQKLNMDMEQLFPEEEIMQRAMSAYAYTEDTLWLVKYVTARLHELRNTESGKEPRSMRYSNTSEATWMRISRG